MFIGIVGVDGAGKSTQCNLLSRYLSKQGVLNKVCQSFGKLEHILFDQFFEGMISEEGQQLIFTGFHAENRSKIQILLSEEVTVIADRWRESSEIYNMLSGPFKDDPTFLEKIHLIAYQNLDPELCFFLDVEIETVQSRLQQRGKIDKYDQHSIDQFNSIATLYREFAQKRNWVKIDGNRSLERVHYEIRHKLVTYSNTRS